MNQFRTGLLASLFFGALAASGCEPFVGDLENDPVLIDNDGDGIGAEDCDDNDPSIQTGCAEATPQADVDNDGYSPAEGDCDDGSATVHPNAAELCNSIDDNCDGAVDEDLDGCDEGDLPEGKYTSKITVYTPNKTIDSDGFRVSIDRVWEDELFETPDYNDMLADAGSSFVFSVNSELPYAWKISATYAVDSFLVEGYAEICDPYADSDNAYLYAESGVPELMAPLEVETEVDGQTFSYSLVPEDFDYTYDAACQCWDDDGNGTVDTCGSAAYIRSADVLGL